MILGTIILIGTLGQFLPFKMFCQYIFTYLSLSGRECSWKKPRVAQKRNWGFPHDVTKIQTRKLSILLGYYFHDSQKQLINRIQTNFGFEWVLGFAIDYI